VPPDEPSCLEGVGLLLFIDALDLLNEIGPSSSSFSNR